MLQACLNGARTKQEHPQIPISDAELVRDAVAAITAGAEQLHLHPRNADGEESLSPADIARCLHALHDALPAVPIGVGTGAWIAPGGSARLRLIAAWHVRPHYASVNLNEEDAPETIALLQHLNIGVEAGLWGVADAERFIALPEARDCLRILIEMTTDDGAEAEREYRRVKTILDQAGFDLPILLHGEGGSVWPMIRLAGAEGHDTRVGFEDGLLLPTGTPARGNAELVRAAVLEYRG